MAYVDYLPNQACLGRVTTLGHTKIINGINVRRYYDNTVFINSASVEAYTTPLVLVKKGLYAEFTEYSGDDATPITYNTGDTVMVESLGLVYRYAGIDPLTINTANFDDKHPSAIDENNTRINSDIWVVSGHTTIASITDPSILKQTYIKDTYRKKQSAVIASKRNNFSGYSRPRKESYKLFSIFNIGGCVFARVTIYDEQQSQVESFEVDMMHKRTLSLKLPATVLVSGGEVSEWADYYAVVDLFGKDDANPNVPENHVSIGTIASAYITDLGSSLKGHTSQRVSEYKTVISDGVEKTMTTKSYDTFSGSVHLPKEKLQEVEYALAQATQGDYVFHIGVQDELYDQRVYLGRIEYSSPLEYPSSFEISISGQSLSYGVENPLIAPDSTDGYTQ